MHIGVLAILVMLTMMGSSQADVFQLGGYAKSYFVDSEFPTIKHAIGGENNPAPSGSVVNRLRLNAQLRFTDRVSVHASYDLAPQVRDNSSVLATVVDFSRFDASGGYRVDDLEPQLYPSLNDPVGNFTIQQNLDRAFVSIHANPADIIAGRQAIAFGTARVINPTDVIAPFAYQALDTEDRPGVDAIRVRKPLGFMGELDLGYLPGKDLDIKDGAWFVRGKYYIARTDASGIVAVFRENLMIGLSLARAIGGASAWFEAAQVWIDEMADPQPPNRQKYLRLSTGADYSVTDKLYGLIEYHYNGAGSNNPDQYLTVIASKAFAEGNVFLVGKHYLIPGATYQFTPLITGTAEVLANLSDASVYLSPSVEYNVAENVYLAGGAYIGLGKGTTLDPSVGRPYDVGSEFGLYPDIFYTSFRVYF